METATAVVDDVEFAEADAAIAAARQGHHHNAIVEVPDGYAAARNQVVPAPSGGFTSLIEKAVVAGNLDLVDRMMSLQERWEKNEGVKAFNNALAAAKAEIKPIIKNRRVKFAAKNGGANTDYEHEDIAGIADSIDEILGRHGLFYRWRPTNNPETGLVTVTCIVSHSLGHAEETTLSGKIDASGNKNHLQAVGSAVTYIERYTLKAALGLASKHDDDGRAASAPIRVTSDAPAGAPIADETGELLSPKQINDLRDLIVDRGVSVGPFIRWVQNSAPNVKKIDDIPACFFEDCIAAIKKNFPVSK